MADNLEGIKAAPELLARAIRTAEDLARLDDTLLATELEDGEAPPLRVPSPTELESLLERHARWVATAGRDGEQLDAGGLDLSHADLAGRVLTLMRGTGVCLRGADLRGAQLQAASLTGADLRSANLKMADLRGSNLDRANLIDANLERTKLCVLVTAKGARVPATLIRARLAGAVLTGTDFSGADLTAADLTGCDRASALFDGATLDGLRG